MALRTVKLDKAPEIPIEMRRTHGRFEHWRKSHRGRIPIPDALWRAAAELAQVHGVFRTAKVLRLDYTTAMIALYDWAGMQRRRLLQCPIAEESILRYVLSAH